MTVIVAASLSAPLGAQSLRGFTVMDSATASQKRPIFVELYADGNLRKAMEDGGGSQVAAGSLGLNARGASWVLDLLVNAAGSQGSVRRGFATGVLAPGSGGSLSAGLVEGRKLLGKPTSRRRPGVRGYASAGSMRWEPDTTLQAADVTVSGLGAGVFFGLGGTVPSKAVDDSTGKEVDVRKPVSAVIDAGVAFRAVGGDILRASNDSVRRLVGMDRRNRLGAELGVAITYAGLKAGLTYYRFGGDMPGLSNGQIVAGFAVQSSLAAGLLNP